MSQKLMRNIVCHSSSQLILYYCRLIKNKDLQQRFIYRVYYYVVYFLNFSKLSITQKLNEFR